MHGYKFLCKLSKNLKAIKKKESIFCLDDYLKKIEKIKSEMKNEFFKRHNGEKISNDLWYEVLNSDNYYDDIIIAQYMFWGIQNAGSSELKYEVEKTNDMIIEVEGKVTDEEEKIPKRMSIEQCDDLKEYFPFEIKKAGSFSYITTWCNEFQQILWDQNTRNILFINQKKAGKKRDITRYKYEKSENMYKKLKNEKIENLIMFEMTLGFKLTNIIHGYLLDIKKREVIEKIDNILEMLCEIPGINMRKIISQHIFFELRENKFEAKEVKKMEVLLRELLVEIKKNYDNLLEMYGGYFLEQVEKRDEDIFDYAAYLNWIREKVENGQKEYWDDYGLCSSFDEYSVILNRKYYAAMGLLQLKDLDEKIKDLRRLIFDLGKKYFEVCECIRGSNHPELLEFKSDFTNTKFENEKLYGEESIIRSSDNLNNENSSERQDWLQEVEKRLNGIFKKAENKSIKSGMEKITTESGYAELHERIIYYLLTNVSKEGKIPVNIKSQGNKFSR